MNRYAIPASLLLSASLAMLSLTPAQAGGAINKCIDGAGRVTLTDQACDSHTVSATIAVPGTPERTDAIPDNAPLAAPATRMLTPPVREARWLPAALPHAALAGDMATMRQAHIQMMLQDAAPRNRLAAR